MLPFKILRTEFRWSATSTENGLFLVILLLCSVAFWPNHARAQSSKPNIIFINLDDADTELFANPSSASLFPNIQQLASDGVSFNNFHVTTPLCGPSRACLYRGQYAHNTESRINLPGTFAGNGYEGGFRFYRERGYFENDLSQWMKTAGYRTMMVGKFLHADFQPYSPPGWDDFRSVLGGRYFGAYVFSNESRPQGRAFQLPETKYRTTYELEESVKLISQQVAERPNQPFFLNINTLGPHRGQASRPEMYEPRMENWWTRITQPRTPAYNESDMSDKAGFLLDLPPFSLQQDVSNDIHYRDRVLATRSVDDLVGAVRNHLTALGIANNTYVFVSSDNGYILGQQRYLGKGVPYERASRVPCFVVGPNVPEGLVSNHLIGHIDLAPTFVSLGGSRAPSFIDGRSFERLLEPEGILNTPHHRLALLIENWANVSTYGVPTHSASMSVRFRSEIYTEWADGGREYFDLSDDPEQLDNGYDQLDANRQAALASWLRVLYSNDRKAEARFLYPLKNQTELAVGGPLQGMAEHGIGVEEVRLIIWDRLEKKYWNGTQWQDDVVQLQAELSNPGGQLTRWQYHDTPDENNFGSERYVAFAWAYDGVGDFAPPRRILFQLDRTPPTISISDEVPTESGRPVAIFGIAQDSVGAETVTCTVRNSVTQLYWNGSVYQSDPFDFEVSVDSRGNWQWEDSLEPGRFHLSAVALDASGNASDPAVFAFRVQ